MCSYRGCLSHASGKSKLAFHELEGQSTDGLSKFNGSAEIQELLRTLFLLRKRQSFNSMCPVPVLLYYMVGIASGNHSTLCVQCPVPLYYMVCIASGKHFTLCVQCLFYCAIWFA